MMKLIKSTAPFWSVGIAIVTILVLILFFIPAYNISQSVGNAFGTSVGEAVGTAIGSYNGLTQDYWVGLNEGKGQGLSADDTEVTDITSIIQETEKLQVLVARVTLDVSHEVGDKYAAIYLLRGEAIFTVDLSGAQIDNDLNIVMIPQPEVHLDFDESEVEKIAEWQTKFFDSSTKDGYTAYMNSIEQSKENATEFIANYDELIAQAQGAAKKQVQMLVMNMTGKSVSVLFSTGGQG